MRRVHKITRAIQEYDRLLYAQEGAEGRIDIFRKTYRYVAYDMGEFTLSYPVEEPYRVFCLTDNWRAWGRPVEWGILPILAKLQGADLWKRNIGKDVNDHNEKIKASEARDLSNKTEAFVKDFRKEYARMFEDVNTSNMTTRTDRRFKDDKKLNLKG